MTNADEPAMLFIKKLVNDAYKALVEDLKLGDEYELSGSYDRPIKISKKAMKHRIDFLESIRELLKNQTLTTQQANIATNTFGKKTTNIFWCKN